MPDSAFQDQGSVLHCYGCGTENKQGLQLKSYWDGESAIADFDPKSYHCGGSPDIVYGGLIASLIDCHSCNLAVASAYKNENREIGSEPPIYCVTAQLNISLLMPTPISNTIHLRASIRETERRKIWVECEVSSDGELTAKAEVLAIRLKSE